MHWDDRVSGVCVGAVWVAGVVGACAGAVYWLARTVAEREDDAHGGYRRQWNFLYHTHSRTVLRVYQ